MMRIAFLLLLGSFLARGQPRAAKAPSVEQKLIQMEHEWAQAQIKKDYVTVDKILAPDWEGVDYDGQLVPKHDYMAHMRSAQSALQFENILSIKVRVYGNTAVVTGKDTEKSSDRGKDSSGTYSWTDVFVLRNGRWQVVASQSTRVQ